MELAIYILTSVLILFGLFIAYETYRVRKEARLKHHEITWVLRQLDRALKQLESTDEQTVLAGLQAIVVLNDDEIRNRALRRVMRLTQSTNPRIAREAQFTLNRLSTTPMNEKTGELKSKIVESVKYV